MGKRKKIGIIGCGGIAQVHGWVIAQREDAELVAVCDLEKTKANKLCEKYGAENCRIETDWRRLCDFDLDVVHICTPHYLHAPMAVELLKCDKAVFMEKPCAISREQYARICEADKEHPGKLGFCFQNRYNETTEMTESLIAENRIGKVIGARAFVTWRRDEEYYGSSLWKGRKDREGGGALINQAIHTLDLMLRYLGKPTNVQATMANHHLQGSIEVEDTVEAWMEFEGGRRACFYASNAYVGDAPVILEIQGENGRITVCDQEVTLYTRDKGTWHHSAAVCEGIGKSYWGAGHKACINDFYDSLDQGTGFAVNLESIEATFDTMMRIYESSTQNG